MKNAYASYSTRRTSQREAIPTRESEMAENNAGGFAFTISNWDRLNRFLVLGSDAPTYYTSAQELTKRNAQSVLACLGEDGKRVVDIVVDVSVSGRAPRNDAALFALAMCAGEGDAETRKYALEKLPKVARISTHLFHFLEYCVGEDN